MEICKAPTSRLKALNKHNTHIIVHRDRECYPQVKKQLRNVHTKGSNRAMYKMHSHTLSLPLSLSLSILIGVKDNAV